MKKFKLTALLILALALVIGSFTSCEYLEDLGITTPDDSNTPTECAHSQTYLIGEKAATCTAKGYTGDRLCDKCGALLERGSDVDLADHVYEDGKCKTCGKNEGSVTPPDGDSTTVDEWKATYECITIAEALALCEQFVDSPSADRYYIIATIKSVDNPTYGQLTIEDETGSIMVYGTYNADGSTRYDAMADAPVAGDTILIHGTLQNYKGNTKEVQNARLIDRIAGVVVPPSIDKVPGDTITIEEALTIAGYTGANDRYYIRATVSTITNAAYGAMIIEDETGSISVYNSANSDGSIGYANMEDKPYKGDTVLLYCTLQNFNGTKEVKSAYIVEFEHAELDINPDDYALTSISDARLLADGTVVKVSGVVARITYATGFKPSGFFLIDGTQSIYVYDGDLAARVAEGNTVTVIATKAHWILDNEQSNANKFGYKGCNQLTDAYLIENDGLVNDFNKSWITETTVKDIIETPVTEDITTIVYKVNALVKKVIPESGGFVNYYFFDIDGETGTYAYTQCNGGDFEWLDQFDGKICTVYITALNAKSTASACYFRFVPVSVIDEGYVFDTTKAPEYALEYHVMGQFDTTYSADPELELITSVSSSLLGFEGVNVSYASSDETVAKINTVDGKTVLNLIGYGDVTITVTAEYNGSVATRTVSISHVEAEEFEYITVDEAINTEIGEIVIVKGIVGPSLVNQTGFYLMDDTGLIAVTMTADEMTKVEFGQEIILTGTRYRKLKDGYTGHGQTQLLDCTVLANNYGDHTYSSDNFVTDKTLADFYELDVNVDYTTTVFVLEATVQVNQYNIKLIDNQGHATTLYASGVGQYSWLKDYEGQEITVELAACNWNSKSYYAGCVLSVILDDGTKIYNTLNFN